MCRSNQKEFNIFTVIKCAKIIMYKSFIKNKKIIKIIDFFSNNAYNINNER